MSDKQRDFEAEASQIMRDCYDAIEDNPMLANKLRERIAQLLHVEAERAKGMRRVEWSGHQCSGEGWFHGWSSTSERARAIIESDGGHISEVEAYLNMRFLSPLGKAQP